MITVRHFPDNIDPRPPLRWQLGCTNGGPYTGTIPHLTEKLFDDMGFKTEWLTGDVTKHTPPDASDHPIQQLATGELAFIVTAKDISESNHQLIKLEVPLAFKRASIITRSSHPVFEGGITALKRYTGSVQAEGDRVTPFLNYITVHQLNAINFSGFDGAMQALVDGEVDYAIVGHTPAKLWELEHGLYGQLHYDDINTNINGFQQRGVYLITQRDGPYAYLIDEVNNRLSDYHKSGLIDHLNDAYLRQWILSPCK